MGKDLNIVDSIMAFVFAFAARISSLALVLACLGTLCNAACSRDTKGNCRMMECKASRNAVCSDGECLCKEGECAEDGKCIRDPSLPVDPNASAPTLPKQCESHQGCVDKGLAGNCCPTDAGDMLDCCESSCKKHGECAGMDQDFCCPTLNGTYLECCCLASYGVVDGCNVNA